MDCKLGGTKMVTSKSENNFKNGKLDGLSIEYDISVKKYIGQYILATFYKKSLRLAKN